MTDRPIYHIVTKEIIGYARDVERHDVADLPVEFVTLLYDLSQKPEPRPDANNTKDAT